VHHKLLETRTAKSHKSHIFLTPLFFSYILSFDVSQTNKPNLNKTSTPTIPIGMFSLASSTLSRSSTARISATAAACSSSRRRFLSTLLRDSYENILVDVHTDDKTALITLNRPKALNALSDGLLKDVLHATHALDKDPSIRCFVLTGSTKAFAAGADISEMHTRGFEEAYSTDMFSEWQQLSKLTSTPWIAAVSGFCLGGGCEVAMMSDILVASESAKFGQPEINLGVIAGAGGTQRLTRAIGKSKSMYMHLTGEFINAQEAYQSGLVAKVFSDDELVEEALKIAKTIAGKGALAVQAAKEAVNASQELPLQEGLRLERRLFHSLFATDDQTEGMAAFLEKRPANFK
jgi:enoyl-CoA hydratase/carnithine racemase